MGKQVNIFSITANFAAALKMTGILCQVFIWLFWQLCVQHCLLH